jgi:outer membrane biosynthesis protein TonB
MNRRAVFFAVLLAGCASAPPPAPVTQTTASAGPSTTTGVTPSAGPFVECDLVCERAKVVSAQPDHHAQATANVNRVLEAMHPQLLACYEKRVVASPDAHGFITVDILVAPDGSVRDVGTTGGALLGARTMDCIVEQVRKAKFDPPHGGGTMRVEVPFSLRTAAQAELQ